MVVNLEEDVAVTSIVNMKKLLTYILLLISSLSFAQDSTMVNTDSNQVFKKRVLENAEIDLLSSYYTQDGNNAAVTGGIGTEELKDFATNINISIPLSDDDILSIDGTVSAYTSASSSNLNPFTGASSNGEDDDDGPRIINLFNKQPITGTPWAASSGASRSDVWINANGGYSHYSDNRNNIWNINLSVANEFDYTSFGFGGGYTMLFNEKNTEIGIKTNIYLDHWKPQYPTEIKSYIETSGNLNEGFFIQADILDSNGNVVNKNDPNIWNPVNTTLIQDKKRNSYSFSISFSQIISRNAQFSIFSDIVQQQGWLANPMQRVYFADKANYYIGTASSISDYTSYSNKDVFQLADDIERLPDTRLKTPIGVRFNYFINEFLTTRLYYRYYIDSWNVIAHTYNIELPIKIGGNFTFYPSYRYYIQTAAKYFAPFEQHLSTEKYYTSDYDLSAFTSNQYGFGIKYTDIFTSFKIGKLGLKHAEINYSIYDRSTGLKANIISFGTKFIIE